MSSKASRHPPTAPLRPGFAAPVCGGQAPAASANRSPALRVGSWLVVGVAAAVLLWGGYSQRWPWTGINEQTATLWDWLNLVLLPIAFALLPVWFDPKKRVTRRHKQIAAAAVLVFATVVAAGYLIPWPWTGFAGNTLWQWLVLFLLPLAVALAPIVPKLRARRTRRATLLAAGALGMFTAIALLGYLDHWAWTGFPGTTLWDWLHLLLLPLVVSTIVIPVLQPKPRPKRERRPAEDTTTARPATPPPPVRANPQRPRTNTDPQTLELSHAGAECSSVASRHATGATFTGRPALTGAARHPRLRLVRVTGPLAGALVVIALAPALSGEIATFHNADRRPVANAHRATSLRQDVSRLNAIVRLFIVGKRLSHIERQYTAAAQNRTRVLAGLTAFGPPPQLQAATETLDEMTANSLAFNLLMATGQTAPARAPDNLHNQLRSRFIAQFNPYAHRYLRLTYAINDL